MSSKVIKVEGMTCQHCVKSVTAAVSSIAPGADVKVDLAKGEVTVQGAFVPDDQRLHDAIESIGFEVVSS